MSVSFLRFVNCSSENLKKDIKGKSFLPYWFRSRQSVLLIISKETRSCLFLINKVIVVVVVVVVVVNMPAEVNSCCKVKVF